MSLYDYTLMITSTMSGILHVFTGEILSHSPIYVYKHIASW